MKVLAPNILACLLGVTHGAAIAWSPVQSSVPTVVDSSKNLTYHGVYESQVEAFLGIQYGQDTSGENRFRPPRNYTYQAGSTVAAQTNGPACPQPLGDAPFPVYLSNITEISENCLLLNVKRPNGTTSSSSLPVMVFIHGDSFIGASKDELVSQPSGLILESVMNGYPVIAVAMNYRLGVFGFAQSDALRQEGSENAGLRDQRLAIEWVHNNIVAFGGDPSKITIFGQSSGGLAIGMQILAYGGSQPAPFYQGICESQALEPGITGNFTRMAMARLLSNTTCNTTSQDSEAAVACLRGVPLQQLVDAQTNTYSTDPSANIGDEWLPVVDGDFLPDSPSNLLAQGRFANVATIVGWCHDDVNPYTPFTIETAEDTDRFLRGYLPAFTNANIETLESLYPVSEFAYNPANNLSAEFFRSSRILRDILMTCQPIHFSQSLSARGNNAYLYEQNQTILDPVWASIGIPDLGVVHTSEFAYVFGNFSHYDVDNFPFQPNASDYALQPRESRSWSSFAATGNPSMVGKTTLQGWGTAFSQAENTDIFVIGGPQEGLFAWSEGANADLNSQNLAQRCAFLNSREIILQLQY